MSEVKIQGFPVACVLGIVFVALKLTSVVAWPWLWVLAPFWIPFAMVAAGLVVALIVAVVVALFGD